MYCLICTQEVMPEAQPSQETVNKTFRGLFPDISSQIIICSSCFCDIESLDGFKLKYIKNKPEINLEISSKLQSDGTICRICFTENNDNSLIYFESLQGVFTENIKLYFPEIVCLTDGPLSTGMCQACFSSFQKYFNVLDVLSKIKNRKSDTIEHFDGPKDVIHMNEVFANANNEKNNQIFKCEYENCTYQSDKKYSLKRHQVIHKDKSEVVLYKCTVCKFETRHRNTLRRHSDLHKPVEDIVYHKCLHCTYKSKWKKDLVRHLLCHKNIDQVTMYKCDMCSYESKRKADLKIHLEKHKPIKELTIYKCNECSYETYKKQHLTLHSVSHKKDDEVTWFNCQDCSYKTKYRSSINNHVLTHKSTKDIPIYKCPDCRFKTKHRGNIKKHIVIHKEPTEIKMFKCPQCTFESKYKSSMKNHILKHQK